MSKRDLISEVWQKYRCGVSVCKTAQLEFSEDLESLIEDLKDHKEYFLIEFMHQDSMQKLKVVGNPVVGLDLYYNDTLILEQESADEVHAKVSEILAYKLTDYTG